MTSLIFAKRNIKEQLRSPINLFFTLAFPILMFFVFQLIKLGTGATDKIVPMFATNNLIPSIAVFSYTFVSLTQCTQIAKDRETAFQARLTVSPMQPKHFFWGYFLPSLAIVVVQTTLCFVVGLCFGLKFTLGTLLAFLSLIPISLFYICVGIILGSVLGSKSCAGVATIFVQLTSIFSGMFFPLTEGTFRDILTCFPFLPSVAIPQCLIAQTYQDIVLYVLILSAYTIVAFVFAHLLFSKQLKNK
ncbi:MAG: ABC transporter permease [Clostridia bacterium]|nr:ABC transporter permease [Clostridia bacterium]